MSSQPQRVLIIDDHAPFRAAARELLERRGFTVVAEADGATAGFEAAQAFGPDAVVLDINLPDGNGIDVCRALRHASPALVVLLISADTANGRWAKDCRAAAFLPKDRLASADLVALLRGDFRQLASGPPGQLFHVLERRRQRGQRLDPPRHVRQRYLFRGLSDERTPRARYG